MLRGEAHPDSRPQSVRVELLDLDLDLEAKRHAGDAEEEREQGLIFARSQPLEREARRDERARGSWQRHAAQRHLVRPTIPRAPRSIHLT